MPKNSTKEDVSKIRTQVEELVIRLRQADAAPTEEKVPLYIKASRFARYLMKRIAIKIAASTSLLVALQTAGVLHMSVMAFLHIAKAFIGFGFAGTVSYMVVRSIVKMWAHVWLEIKLFIQEFVFFVKVIDAVTEVPVHVWKMAYYVLSTPSRVAKAVFTRNAAKNATPVLDRRALRIARGLGLEKDRTDLNPLGPRYFLRPRRARRPVR